MYKIENTRTKDTIHVSPKILYKLYNHGCITCITSYQKSNNQYRNHTNYYDITLYRIEVAWMWIESVLVWFIAGVRVGFYSYGARLSITKPGAGI